MADALQKLVLPDKGAKREVWDAFAKKLYTILDTYRDQWDPFRLLAVTEEEVLPWKELSQEQIERWINYLQANSLLVRCLQVAYLPNRQALEDKILLPPESW